MIATHLSLALALALPAQAAADAPLSLPQLLAHLGEEALRLRHALPSFTCQQSVISQELKKGKVVRSVALTATVSAQRREDGKLDESFVPITVDGRPFSGGFTMPTYVTGGFSRTLVYFLPDQQLCFRYTLSRGRIDFTTAKPLPDGLSCRSQGMSGFALLDAQGDVVHLERRVTPEFSRRFQFNRVRRAGLRAGELQRGNLPAGQPAGRRGQPRQLHRSL